MKYKIEKNTVQETLIIPLYARKVCSELYPNLYQDETAVRLINEIDYDFSDADKNARTIYQNFHTLPPNLIFTICIFIPLSPTLARNRKMPLTEVSLKSL